MAPNDIITRLGAILGPRGLTTDAAEMDPWLRDWRGRVRGEALALASPASVDQVAAIMAVAAATGTPLVPQGGNTSMVAGATPGAAGDAILLSLRRMAAIRTVSPVDNVIVAEAGSILADVHAAADAVGRRFPLSLAAKGSATIGGLISTNAGGTQVLRFGTMRALVLGIEAVLPDGRRFDGLSALRKDNRGYDLRQLLIGAEGTLGIVTAASLKLIPAIGRRAVAWVGLNRAEDALRLLRFLEERTGDAIESFEIIPASGLALVIDHIPGARAPLADAHPWHVLIEATAPIGAPPPEDGLGAALADAIGLGFGRDATIAANEAQARALWHLRETLPEGERVDGPAAKHDVSIPVSRMPAFIEETSRAVEDAFPGTRVLAFGHLGDGNVHFNVRGPEGCDRAAWLARDGAEINRFVHDHVAGFGGSLSAEHGIGQTKLAEFERLSDPVRIDTMRAIKCAIDPLGIMNPGKLVPLATGYAAK